MLVFERAFLHLKAASVHQQLSFGLIVIPMFQMFSGKLQTDFDDLLCEQQSFFTLKVKSSLHISRTKCKDFPFPHFRKMVCFQIICSSSNTKYAKCSSSVLFNIKHSPSIKIKMPINIDDHFNIQLSISFFV